MNKPWYARDAMNYGRGDSRAPEPTHGRHIGLTSFSDNVHEIVVVIP